MFITIFGKKLTHWEDFLYAQGGTKESSYLTYNSRKYAFRPELLPPLFPVVF
jgi:hypothetical protein